MRRGEKGGDKLVCLPFPNVMPVNRGCETTSYVRVYRLRATRVAQAPWIHDSPYSQRKQSVLPLLSSLSPPPPFRPSLSNPSPPTGPRPAPELSARAPPGRGSTCTESARGVVSTPWPIERWPARSRRGPSSSLNLVPLRRISPASLPPLFSPPPAPRERGHRVPETREDAPLVLAGISRGWLRTARTPRGEKGREELCLPRSIDWHGRSNRLLRALNNDGN